MKKKSEKNGVILSKHSGIKYFHSQVQCLSIVYTKYQSVPEINMRELFKYKENIW